MVENREKKSSYTKRHLGSSLKNLSMDWELDDSRALLLIFLEAVLTLWLFRRTSVFLGNHTEAFRDESS